MDKYTVKLVEGFLSAQYERFQVYLEAQDIESTEAECIIGSLTASLVQPFKFDMKNKPAKSKTVYSCDGEEVFTECWENILNELSDRHPNGSIVSILKGVSVPAAHQQFIFASEIIESMRERAFEGFDDLAGTYLNNINKPHVDQLQQLLIDWFDKNAEQPTFYNVKNIKEIEITVGENEPCQN